MRLTAGHAGVMRDDILDLFGVHGLVELIQQLYLVLPHQHYDLLLDVLVAQCLHHSFPLLWAEVGLQALCNLPTDLLHDLHVWTLCYLSSDLNLVSM